MGGKSDFSQYMGNQGGNGGQGNAKMFIGGSHQSTPQNDSSPIVGGTDFGDLDSFIPAGRGGNMSSQSDEFMKKFGGSWQHHSSDNKSSGFNNSKFQSFNYAKHQNEHNDTYHDELKRKNSTETNKERIVKEKEVAKEEAANQTRATHQAAAVEEPPAKGPADEPAEKHVAKETSVAPERLVQPAAQAEASNGHEVEASPKAHLRSQIPQARAATSSQRLMESAGKQNTGSPLVGVGLMIMIAAGLTLRIRPSSTRDAVEQDLPANTGYMLLA